ncbi:MAG: DEAD/DEAH box helicase [Methanomassiliicoccales archaeon]|jgi:helicase|nr:DEAD/DEAH box helicase [Methanomassiliicoccales archaeon]
MVLEKLGIPDDVVEILKKDGIVTLYPPQEEALPHALAGKNLVLAVPTASGKSLVAYLAALKHVLERGGKVLYIVPLRALATEKYEDLKKFEELGIRVEMSVGDFDTPDPELEKFDIIVATSEKADSLLRHRSRWLERISLVVADEIHLIHDPERGPTLEITLARFRRFNPNIQIIALSATIKNSRELADWLNAVHISSNWRPVPLKEGVLCEGIIKFTDNTMREIRDRGDVVWSLISDAILTGGQCLIFVNTRKSAESLAVRYAPKMKEILKDRVEIDGLDDLIDEDESTSVGKRLKSCMRKGIAFHHAGLTNEQRKLVEKSFRNGTIKCIIATPTLAAGINLPARMVVIRDVYRYESDVGNVSIPVLEIKQMCGRAGRPRFDPYGEAVLIARNESEMSFLMENYLLGEPEEIFSKLGNEAVLRSHILAAIATGVANSMETLMTFFSMTFFAHQVSITGLGEAAERIIEFLEKEGMIRVNEEILPTFFGRRVSDLYIDPLTAVRLRDALKAYKAGSSDFGFLHAICSTPDMRHMYLRRGEYEVIEEVYSLRKNELLLPAPEDLTEYEFYLSELKTACALEEWIEEVGEEEILERYNMGPGDLRNKVEIAEWLLYSMRELANIFNREAYPALNDLVVRLRYGVRKELLDLVRLRGVGRVRARMLFNSGFRTLDDLRNAELHAIARVPRIGEALARSIKAQLETTTKPGLTVPSKELRVEKETTLEGQRKLTDF